MNTDFRLLLSFLSSIKAAFFQVKSLYNNFDEFYKEDLGSQVWILPDPNRVNIIHTYWNIYPQWAWMPLFTILAGYLLNLCECQTIIEAQWLSAFSKTTLTMSFGQMSSLNTRLCPNLNPPVDQRWSWRRSSLLSKQFSYTSASKRDPSHDAATTMLDSRYCLCSQFGNLILASLVIFCCCDQAALPLSHLTANVFSRRLLACP